MSDVTGIFVSLTTYILCAKLLLNKKSNHQIPLPKYRLAYAVKTTSDLRAKLLTKQIQQNLW